MITLLKNGGRYVWEELDDYRPITLLNTDMKILAWVLANWLQLIVNDLIGPEQNYSVNGRSIQDNLRLVRGILKGIEDDTEAALISPKPLIGWFISFWWRFRRPLDSNRSPADGSAFCTAAPKQWCRWIESDWGSSQLSSWSSRLAPFLLFSTSLPWSPCSVGKDIEKKANP